MDQQNEREEALAKMLRADESLLKRAFSLLEKQEKEKPVRVSARSYRTVNVIHQCSHCGARYERTVRLQQKDSYVYTSLDGKVCLVSFKMLENPITILCSTPTCEKCKEFVASLPREELEQRYLELVERVLAITNRRG